jgi:hypothetical protein
VVDKNEKTSIIMKPSTVGGGGAGAGVQGAALHRVRKGLMRGMFFVLASIGITLFLLCLQRLDPSGGLNGPSAGTSAGGSTKHSKAQVLRAVASEPQMSTSSLTELRPRQKTVISSVSNSKHAVYDSATPKGSSATRIAINILLQLSPVGQKDQIKRLTAIENSWANWVDVKSGTFKLFASVPRGSGLHSFKKFRVIDIDAVQAPNKAYANLMDALFHMYIEADGAASDSDWLVLANDHSFLVPPNLHCYLKALNPHFAVYTGNRLQRGEYKDGFPLYFASGGSGIVLSRPAIIMFFVAMAMNKDSYLLDKLKGQNRISSCSIILNDTKPLYDGQDHGVSGSATKLWCVLTSLTGWISKQSTENMIIRISKHQVVVIEKTTNSQALDHASLSIRSIVDSDFVNRGSPMMYVATGNVSAFMELSNRALESRVDHKRIKNCNANSEWDRQNPGRLLVKLGLVMLDDFFVGLSIAYCLQALFGVKFTDSADSSGAERFNVYGALRSLSGDADDWYITARLPFPGDTGHPTGKVQSASVLEQYSFDEYRRYSASLVSSDVVSFHYVSQLESTLLYNLLCKCISLGHLEITPTSLQSMWPHNDKDAGHYSRWKFISDQEVNVLLWFLLEHARIRNTSDAKGV